MVKVIKSISSRGWNQKIALAQYESYHSHSREETLRTEVKLVHELKEICSQKPKISQPKKSNFYSFLKVVREELRLKSTSFLIPFSTSAKLKSPDQFDFSLIQRSRKK